MAKAWAITLLAVLCGISVVNVAHAQTVRSVTDAFDLLHKAIHGPKPDAAFSKFVVRDGAEIPADNMWRVLGMDQQQQQWNVSQTCLNSTAALLANLAQPWARKMLDATGKLESGVQVGNLQWLGTFTECQSVEVPYPHSNDTNSTQPTGNWFDGMPCTAVMKNASIPTATGLTLGICMPSACSELDVNIIWLTFTSMVAPGFTGYAQCYANEPQKYDAPAIAMIVLLSCLGVVIIIGTMYDLLVAQGGWRQMQGHTDKPQQINSDEEGVSEAQNVDDYAQMNGAAAKNVPQPSTGVLGKLLVSFSIATNARKILAVQKSQASLDAIHGIRFISMSWVILGHTYAFSLGMTSNMLDFFTNTIGTWHFQAILNALVSVDTFFLLSGTLVAYLLLKELDRCGGPLNLNWAKFYFHRFWRLTPPYMILLGAHAALFKYLGTGPLWPKAGMEPFCSKNWWTNILYLNNVVENDKQCMGWTWYLANDMQFFIISPIFIVALYKNWIAGLVVTFVGLLGTTVATAAITVHYKYGAEMVSLLWNPHMATWMQNVYFPPWCRLGPYLVGILYGYLIFKTKRQVRIPMVLVLLGWMAAAAAALAVLYGLYPEANGHPLSTPMAAFYSSMHRTVWGMAVGWVIFACVTGYGGWVNSFLSWPIFIPLSRLTYMAYLVHPIVMYLFYYTLKRTLFFETLTWVYLFLGHVALSYGVAFIASLAVESPMMGLEKVLLKR